MSEITSKYIILSVDDNETNLFTLTTLLATLQDVQTIEASSAQDALKILLQHQVDLILLDIQMPEMNGFELASLLQSNKKTKDIPIIFVTAVFKSDEFIEQGFSLGAVDYVTKPIDDNQLLNKIKLYLKVFAQKKIAQEREKQFYDIAQSVGDGIYTIDRDMKLTFINNRALEILGYKSSELLGKDIHGIIHYKDVHNKALEASDCAVHATLEDGETYRSNDEYLKKKDGSFLAVSVVSTPLFLDNSVSGAVISFADKTHMQIINNLTQEKYKNQEQMMHSMIELIEARDSYTAGHTRRVAEYCVLIAKEMGYDDLKITLLKNAAWLHDIGKISTPDNVLLKPGKLNDEEYSLIQEHLTSGYKLLSSIDQYKAIAEIMGQHHEKYNGKGYPKGLKYDEIHPLSRIMIVADAFDAMTTNRVYKVKKDVAKAIEELKSHSGIEFHPEVVEASCKVLKNIQIDNTISQLPSNSLEKQRFSYFYKDKLTNLYSIDYLPLLLRYQNTLNSCYLYIVKLHKFSDYNKEFGWDQGDQFLIQFSDFLKQFYLSKTIFRIEGDDFLIFSEVQIKSIEKNLRNFTLFKTTNVEFSVKEEFISNLDEKLKEKTFLGNKFA